MNTFVFVCQSGLIECQSLLLAMSLRRHTTGEEIIAAWPEQFGDIHPFTRKIFRQLDVKVMKIINDFDPLYPCGNKIFAANLPTKGDWVVSLDSDMICMRPPRDELVSYPASAIVTGRFDVITHREWRNCHRSVGLELDTRFKHLRAPVVSYRRDLELPRKWLQNAKSIYSVPLRRVRQVDQISLSLTAQTIPGFHFQEWNRNPLMLSPSEIYCFENPVEASMPIFLVLQKGWLYYKRQGHPEIESNNPNSLAYYGEVRSLIYSLISDYPEIDQIPAWSIIHDLYFSQKPLTKKILAGYLRGVEGGQK